MRATSSFSTSTAAIRSWAVVVVVAFLAMLSPADGFAEARAPRLVPPAFAVVPPAGGGPRRAAASTAAAASSGAAALFAAVPERSGDDADAAVDDGARRPLSRRDALGRAAKTAFAGAAAALGSVALPTTIPAPAAFAAAEEESLTSRMFNPDGSLKSGAAVEEVEAKSRKVEVSFPSGGDSDAAVVSVDGAKPGAEGGEEDAVKVSYSVPQKWSSTPGELYLDSSEGINARAARRIAVYRVPGPADEKTLDKATTIGVAKALGIPSASSQIGYPKSLLGADVVSGRKSVRDGTKYYEFDLAAAPDSCDSAGKENLGLGFCPYDSIVLLGACVVQGKMYVMSVESDRDMWKRANADLKRVRGSFRVEAPGS